MCIERFCLTLSYDGTNYSGWQIQKDKLSIQQEVEKALFTILQDKVTLSGSGRTDSGVHALAQTAHFETKKKINTQTLRKSLNALLPSDIRILEVKKVNPEFHARYSCKRKIYRYFLHTDQVVDPFNRPYRLHFPYSLDLNKVEEGKAYLLGTHDFSSFANRAYEGSANKNPVRTIYRIDIIKKDYGLIFEYEGDGFLYKMVRNITGTLLDIGQKKIPPKQILEILQAKDRKQASTTAPACGLFLVKTIY